MGNFISKLYDDYQKLEIINCSQLKAISLFKHTIKVFNSISFIVVYLLSEIYMCMLPSNI